MNRSDPAHVVPEDERDRRRNPETSDTARSGDFSQDPQLDPNELFEVIEAGASDDLVSHAMHQFLMRGDAPTFERAVALYVRMSRARGEPVERVLGTLTALAERRQGKHYPHDFQPTQLQLLVLRGVLLAFYGEEVVERGDTDRRRRRDALQQQRRRASDAPPEVF